MLKIIRAVKPAKLKSIGSSWKSWVKRWSVKLIDPDEREFSIVPPNVPIDEAVQVVEAMLRRCGPDEFVWWTWSGDEGKQLAEELDTRIPHP